MSVSKLPSGKWRAQVHDPATRRNVSVSRVLGGPGTFNTKREAKAAREQARLKLGGPKAGTITVRQWRERWISDPLFARPSESTNIHHAERTKAFSEKYADTLLSQVGDFIVGQWLAGGKHTSTVPALRLMFGDAMKAKAGRLITSNPFTELGLEKSRGNRDKQPPTEQQAWTLIGLALELTPASFYAYLEFACWSACRPGELDGLKWTDIDFDAGEIHVRRQWNVKSKKFTLPKHRHVHTITLTPRAREVLTRLQAAVRAEEDPRIAGSEWCFTTERGTHYTPSSRTHHWNRVRAGAGLGHVSLYLATRHFFGWYAVNVLDLDSAVVAEQLGHRDGGRLVEQLYGHPDRRLRREKMRAAFEQQGEVRPLRIVRKDTA